VKLKNTHDSIKRGARQRWCHLFVLAQAQAMYDSLAQHLAECDLKG
jgi:hypothetical protein